jgi:hypothetical protein
MASSGFLVRQDSPHWCIDELGDSRPSSVQISGPIRDQPAFQDDGLDDLFTKHLGDMPDFLSAASNKFDQDALSDRFTELFGDMPDLISTASHKFGSR